MPDTKLYIGSAAASFKMGTADCSIYLGDVKMYPADEPVVHIPLTFEILDDNFSFKNAQSFSFKVNGGTTTTVASNTYTTAQINSGDTVEVYANASTASRQFTTNGRFKVKGNPISFSYGETWQSHSGDTITSACTNMFMNCTGLTDASEIELPSSIGMYSCYCMFSGCTNLTAAPELPATTLRSNCYRGMFQGCTSLTTAPSLPATTLADSCYRAMFAGCSGITAAPALLVTDIHSYSNCYNYMFEDCISLTSAPALPATSLADNCYEGMFAGCTGLTTAPELSATTVPSAAYRRMFSGCTSLATAPVIHASAVQASGCNQMFQSCTSLTTAPELSATTLAAHAYNQMFDSCTSLTTAPDLPATTINGLTYSSLFQNCTSLVNAPSISATTFGTSGANNQHMRKMFAGCTGLTTAPSLPATSLQQRCYEGMFSGCTSLTTAPELQATDIPASAYTSMFEGCTSLVESPVLPATTVGTNGYTKMFSGCTSMNKITCLYSSSTAPTFTNWVAGVAASGVFYKAAGMNDWTTGVNGIPSGWSVVSIKPSYCYDVTSDIQSYTSTTYLDVYDSTAEKWYKLNNLNQYEEYGVYGEGKNITTYQGKLTIDSDHEWQWSGSSWVDLGEVSGATGSLPAVSFSVNYNARDYDETTSSLTMTADQNVEYSPVLSGDPVTVNDGYITIDGDTQSSIPSEWVNYLNRTSYESNLTIVCKARASNYDQSAIIFVGRDDFMPNWGYNQNEDNATIYGGFGRSENLSLQHDGNPKICSVRFGDEGEGYVIDDWTDSLTQSGDSVEFGSEHFGNCLLFTNSEYGGSYWHGDFYWLYVSQETLTDAQIAEVIEYNEGGGIDVPVEYSDIAAPPTSVTFQSVAEMEAYVCTYEGLYGFIGTDVYIYTIADGWQIVLPTDKPYLTFVATEAGTFKFSGNSVSYSLNDGRVWTTLASNTDSPTIPAGGKIMLKATLTPEISKGIGTFSSTGRFTASGNPMCLLYGDDFVGQTSLSGKNSAFYSLFSGCTGLTSAENMSLPATTLAENCYYDMFHGCTSLTTAPELPATTLANFCYCEMFYGCTSLTTAPVLSATTLANFCYYSMFSYCTNLNSITCLATDISASNCIRSWVYQVAANGTFTKAASMSSWATGANGIPQGWTVEDAS